MTWLVQDKNTFLARRELPPPSTVPTPLLSYTRDRGLYFLVLVPIIVLNVCRWGKSFLSGATGRIFFLEPLSNSLSCFVYKYLLLEFSSKPFSDKRNGKLAVTGIHRLPEDTLVYKFGPIFPSMG